MAKTNNEHGPTETIRWGLRAGALTTALTVAAGTMLTCAVQAPSGAAALHGVRESLSGAKWGDSRADKVAKDAKGTNTASSDPGSLFNLETAIGARKVWAMQDAGRRQITGQGVTVALLDSGTAQVTGLNDLGKVTYGPDLSIESNGVLANQDTFGHGTHMAGIIAARDSVTLTAKSIPGLDPSVQLGVAPDAGLLSMKLSNTDGSTDVSEVIAALNWVTEHQTAADGSRIRVVNLSYGTDSVQANQLDPLAAAAENAWRHGLVVVVSGGNDGNDSNGLTDPAMNPYVIAVGAADNNNTVGGWTKPTVAPFSNGGNAQRHVDLLAPGTSIASLRDPGSYVDVNHPEGLVSGDITGRLFRGSGTSQAAAVVSGSVALLLQAYPNLTPDQVKAVLTSSAVDVPVSALYAGAGELNVEKALAAAKASGSGATFKGVTGITAAASVQKFAPSTGQGSLDAARGGTGIVDAEGVPIIGEVDAQGNTWNPVTWWAASSTATSWSGGQWLGVTWTGDTWDTSTGDLESVRWGSAQWTSVRWGSVRWGDSSWTSVRWGSVRWGSVRWGDATWSSVRWGDSSWSDDSWS